MALNGRSRQDTRLIDGLLFLAVMAVAWILQASLTHRGLSSTSDSFSYLDAAWNFAAGNGLVEANFDLNDPSLVKPFSGWPPLYPVLLSFFLSAKTTAPVEATTLSLLLLLGMLSFSWATLRPHVGTKLAALTCLAMALSQPVMTVSTYAWSELPFLTLVSALIWAGGHFLVSRPERKLHYLLLVGLACFLLAMTRYIGLVFFVAFLPLFLIERDKRYWWKRFSLIGLAALLGLGAWYLRNFQLTGHLSGYNRIPAHPGYGTTLHDLANAWIVHLPQSIAPWIGILLIAAVAWIVLVKKGPLPERDKAQNQTEALNPLRLSLTLLTVYLLALFLLGANFSIDRDARMISVVVPTLLISLALIVKRLADRGVDRWWRATLFVGSISLILAFPVEGIQSYQAALVNMRTLEGHRFPTGGSGYYTNFTAISATAVHRNIIDTLSANGELAIVTNRARILYFLTGHRNMKELSPLPFTEETVRNINRRFRDGVLYLYDPELSRSVLDHYAAQSKTIEFRQDLLSRHGVLVVPIPLP
ncbi:MAG: glycosyltransferase family 39 protein [Magnetococcales bacterium]|nr:glycosyltransferase family 39 protein [Magnetococcales bacterium]MBF0156990.1 glycosyltransferase family 39 protein [Magnetococcales bacterium]